MNVRSSGLVALALLLAGCGVNADARRAPQRQPKPLQVTKAHACTPGLRRLGSSRVAYAAVVQRPVRAYRRPGRAGFARFGLENVNRVAIGISAFSNVLTGWTQGGPVAIHGTDEPWSIGRAVSNGCIRLPNALLRRLFRATPAGTPVVVHP